MKNVIFNLNYTSLFTLLVIAFLTTACQKENVLPRINETNTNQTQQLDLSNLNAQLTSNARADSWPILHEVIETTQAGFYTIELKVDEMPDPKTHKIEVTIIPLKSPLDLHVRTFNPNRNPQVQNLRTSNNAGMLSERLTFRQSDFQLAETHAYVMIHTVHNYNEFEVKINAIPVDCEEVRPRREMQVPDIFIPVCGCDGRTYMNGTDAFAHGITSWKRGKCLPNVNIPINGLWQSLDPDAVEHFLEVEEDDCPEITIVFENEPETEYVVIIDCEEEEAENEEERTWTVIDKSKNSFLFWPVEKWSAQVNGQGELEVYRTDAKHKDEKKEHPTILSRYKRIK